MKTFFKYIILSLVITVGFSACNLDEYPSAELPIDEAWQSVSDARNFKNGLYNELRAGQGGFYVTTSEYQSDLFHASYSFGNNGGDLYAWTFTPGQGNISAIWAHYYSIIANANNILSNIDKVVAKDDAEKKELNNIKGEAYFIRAIAYHTLVLRFTENYDKAKANALLGLPLVETVDVNAKPARSTLKETYDFILSDIANAKSLMTTVSDNIFLGTDALGALEARVNFHLGNYDQIEALVKPLITKYPLVSTAADIKKLWLNDEGSEIIYQSKWTLSELQSSSSGNFSYNTFLNYNENQDRYSPNYIPTKSILDLYDKTTDLRYEVYFEKFNTLFTDREIDDLLLLNKFPGNPDLKTSRFARFNNYKMFRTAELYLLTAEAMYYLGQESTAKTYLNDLRASRGASILNLTGASLLQAIKDEWTREFIGEGFELNNLKRWNKGMKRGLPQNINALFASDVELAIPATNEKFVWEIPFNDLNSNANLKPNWKD